MPISPKTAAANREKFFNLGIVAYFKRAFSENFRLSEKIQDAAMLSNKARLVEEITKQAIATHQSTSTKGSTTKYNLLLSQMKAYVSTIGTAQGTKSWEGIKTEVTNYFDIGLNISADRTVDQMKTSGYVFNTKDLSLKYFNQKTKKFTDVYTFADSSNELEKFKELFPSLFKKDGLKSVYLDSLDFKSLVSIIPKKSGFHKEISDDFLNLYSKIEEFIVVFNQQIKNPSKEFRNEDQFIADVLIEMEQNVAKFLKNPQGKSPASINVMEAIQSYLKDGDQGKLELAINNYDNNWLRWAYRSLFPKSSEVGINISRIKFLRRNDFLERALQGFKDSQSLAQDIFQQDGLDAKEEILEQLNLPITEYDDVQTIDTYLSNLEKTAQKNNAYFSNEKNAIQNSVIENMAPRLKELTQGGDRKNLNALIKPELLIQEADVSKDLNKKVDSYLSGLDSSISAYFQRFFLGDRGLRQEIREATLRNEKLNIQAQLPFYLSNLNSNLNASLPQNYQKLVRDLNSYASNISTVHGTKAWDALDASIKNYFEPNMRIYQDFGIAQNKIALGNESAYILNNDTKTLNYYDGSNQSQKEIADFSKHLLTWNAVQVLFNSLRIKGTNQKSQVLTSSQFMHLTHFALQVNPGAEFKIRSLNKDVPFQVTKGILPLIHQLSRNNRLTIELNNMKSQGFSSVEQTTKTIRDKILTKISDIKTRSNTQSPAYGKLLTAIENYLKSGGSKESVDNLTQAIKTHEGLWFRRWGFEKLFPQDIDRVLDLINLAKESPFFNSALLTIKLQKDGTLTPDPANQTSIDPDILTTVREPFNELKKFQDQVQSTFSGHLDSLTDAINALKGKNYDQASELEARLNTLKNYRQFEITHITEQINETEQLIKDSSAIINIPTSQLGKNPEDLTSTTNDGVEAIKTLTRIFNLPNRTSIPRPQGKAPTPPSSRPTSGLGFSANNTSTSTQKTPEINYPDDAETKAKNSFFDDIRNKAATIKKKTPDNTDAPLPPQPRASIKPETDPKTNLSNPNPAKPASTQLLNDVLKEVKKREGKLEGNQLTDKTNSTQDNNTPPLGKNSRFFNGFEAALVQQAQSLKPVAHMSPKTEESPFEENQFKVLTPDEYTKKLDYFKSRTDQQRAKSIERQIKALKNENGIQDKEQISKQLISFVAQPDQLSMKVLWVQQTGKISPNDGGDDDDNVEEWHDSSNKPH